MTREEKTALEADIVVCIPALRAFARRFSFDKTDADDLVQETLLKALANIDKFTPGTRLKSWMFTIMRNTFCTRSRIAKREAPGIFDTVTLDRAVEASQEWSMEIQELNAALNSLSPNQRDVVVKVTIEGESYEHVAAETGCAIGTIKSRLSRARHELSEKLGRHSFDDGHDVL